MAGPKSPPAGHGHAHDGGRPRLASRQAEERCAFGAEPGRVSRIFLVGAGEKAAVGQQQRGADVKPGVGRVGVGRGGAGGPPGSCLGGAEVGLGSQHFDRERELQQRQNGEIVNGER